MIARLLAHPRAKLYAPFAALALVLVVHAVYWIVVAGNIEDRARAWVAAQERAGYEIGHAGLRVGGYPFRFTLRAAEPRIVAPDAEGGWSVDLERLAVSAQFYNLSHWIATLGGPARLSTEIGGEPAIYILNAAAARVSLAGDDGATTRIGAEFDDLVIGAEAGPAPALSAAGSLVLTGRLDPADRFDFRLQSEEVLFAAATVSDDVERAFGRTADLFRMDGALTEWSALAAAGDPYVWTGEGGALIVNAAQLVWGPADLNGAGEITLDPQMRPAGRLSLIVTDPDTLIGALVEGGLVYDEQGEALRLFALMAPRRDTGIALPFRLQDGGLFLGPARIGSVGAVD
ncbi:MAG: DUF2125 domain-containing protein [Oceanicaulis sp.]